MQTTHKQTEPSATSDSGSVYCLQANDFDELWPSVEPLLTKFEEEVGTVSASGIYEAAQCGICQVWVFVVSGQVMGVVTTKIMQNHRGLYCLIWTAIGKDTSNGEHLDRMFSEIESWARKLGCARVEIIGRRGWLRRLDGFKETGIQMEKNIERLH